MPVSAPYSLCVTTSYPFTPEVKELWKRI